MTIPLVKEPKDWQEQPAERCFFCRLLTRFWNENKNIPVCPKCAKVHKVSELPDHGQRVRADKRKARNG